MMSILRLAAVAVVTVALLACASPEEKVAEHLKNARTLMAENKPDKAKIEAKNAVQIDPKNAEAHLILGTIALQKNNLGEAFPQFQMAVEGDPKLLEARLRLGDIFFVMRDSKATLEQAEAAKALAPENPEVRLLVAKSLTLRGGHDEALTEINAALTANPRLMDAITSKASLLTGQGDAAGALAVIDQGLANVSGDDADTLRDFRLQVLLWSNQQEAYEAALLAMAKEFPEKAKYRYQLLDFYTAGDQLDAQERILRELIPLEKDNQLLLLRLSNILTLKDDLPGAQKLLTDGIVKFPDSADLQIGLGDFYRYTKRSKAAMAEYQKAAAKWAETSPEGLLARNRIVAQRTLDGDIEQARADIDAILKVAPDDADALLSRATFAFLDQKYEAAIADLRNVIRRKKSSEALLLLARSYVGAGDPTVAKDTYRRLLDDFPDNADANRELAALLTMQKDEVAATEILRGFVSKNPQDAAASAALIQNLLMQKDVEGAEQEARRMASVADAPTGAQRQLGLVLEAKGESDQALAGYKAVLDTNPNQVEALEGLVRILVRTGRANEALAYLQRASKDNVDAVVLMGNVYGAQGDVVEARRLYEQAIEKNPKTARAYLALAGLESGGSPERTAMLQRGWKAIPGNLEIGLFLAGDQEREGKVEDAIATYDAALGENPSNILVLNNLVALLIDHRKDKASLSKALELAKPLAAVGNPVTMDTLGWAYYRNADYVNAVRQLERAVAMNSDSALMQYHLGKAYMAANNPVSAVQHLEKSLSLSDGKAPFAADARATLAKAQSAAPGT